MGHFHPNRMNCRRALALVAGSILAATSGAKGVAAASAAETTDPSQQLILNGVTSLAFRSTWHLRRRAGGSYYNAYALDALKRRTEERLLTWQPPASALRPPCC